MQMTREMPYLGLSQSDGCWMLAEASDPTLDGVEEELYEIFDGASTLDPWADEYRTRTTWPLRYHLSPSRANLLRPLALDHTLSVLEVGAGCGALTRYLGQRCESVVAIEPALARARVARRRTRDLLNVDVIVGALRQLPRGRLYDVVLVVGVLEYIGKGGTDPIPYMDFIATAVQHLQAGGTLVLAIENQLGVKYLAGAPEEHTMRVFDSIEDYPQIGRGRTFPRDQLASWFRAVGLTPTFLQAFPDYYMPTAILNDGLFDLDRSLGWRLPSFPSPDWEVCGPRVADERSMWRALVMAGLGRQFGNSFVVLATRTGQSSALWPSGQIAVTFETERRGQYATETRLTSNAGGSTFQRTRISNAPIPDGVPQLVLRDLPHVRGRDFGEVVRELDGEQLATWLRRWAESGVNGEDKDAICRIDRLPHTTVTQVSGDLAFADGEALSIPYCPAAELYRAALLTARRLALLSLPGAMRTATIGELAQRVVTAFGLSPDPDWLPNAIRLEAELQTELRTCSRGAPQWPGAVREREGRLHGEMALHLTWNPFGISVQEQVGRATYTDL